MRAGLRLHLSVRLIALSLLLYAPVRAEEPVKGAEPPFLVQLENAKTSPFHGLDRVEVSLRNGEGKQTSRCVLHDGKPRAFNASPCQHSPGWMARGPGRYDFFVSAWRHGEQHPVVVGQSASVSGKELRILARLWFVPADLCGVTPRDALIQKGTRMMLATFTLERTLPAPAELVLKRAWAPLAAGDLKYTIENRGKQEWIGTGNMANFFGRVEVFQGGTWTPYLRGGMCGTDSMGPLLSPGQETKSIEGAYIGAPRPFLPGRYRYVVAVTRDNIAEGYDCSFAAAGAPFLQSVVTYELSDEFSIAR